MNKDWKCWSFQRDRESYQCRKTARVDLQYKFWLKIDVSIHIQSAPVGLQVCVCVCIVGGGVSPFVSLYKFAVDWGVKATDSGGLTHLRVRVSCPALTYGVRVVASISLAAPSSPLMELSLCVQACQLLPSGEHGSIWHLNGSNCVDLFMLWVFSAAQTDRQVSGLIPLSGFT